MKAAELTVREMKMMAYSCSEHVTWELTVLITEHNIVSQPVMMIDSQIIY